MSRNGKIARLPQELRTELNRRLHNGEQANRLVHWLNAQDEVQEMLEKYFAGTAIRKQNLSEWKKGGYAQWQREQETQLYLKNLRESASGQKEAVGGTEISGCFATLLATQMTELAQSLLDKEAEPEKRWKRLCQVHKQISRMRKDDYRGVKSTIIRQRWEQEGTKEDENHPSEWMTPEEKAAKIRRVFGRETAEDLELLRKASWKGWRPKNKREAYERIFGTITEEEEVEEAETLRGDGQGI